MDTFIECKTCSTQLPAGATCPVCNPPNSLSSTSSPKKNDHNIEVKKEVAIGTFVKCKTCSTKIPSGADCPVCTLPAPNEKPGSQTESTIIASIILVLIVLILFGGNFSSSLGSKVNTTVELHNKYGIVEGYMDKEKFRDMCNERYATLGKSRQEDCKINGY